MRIAQILDTLGMAAVAFSASSLAASSSTELSPSAPPTSTPSSYRGVGSTSVPHASASANLSGMCFPPPLLSLPWSHAALHLSFISGDEKKKLTRMLQFPLLPRPPYQPILSMQRRRIPRESRAGLSHNKCKPRWLVYWAFASWGWSCCKVFGASGDLHTDDMEPRQEEGARWLGRVRFLCTLSSFFLLFFFRLRWDGGINLLWHTTE